MLITLYTTCLVCREFYNLNCKKSSLLLFWLTLKSSLRMRPLRKSFTNWVFSAFSWTSLVPAASISDRSSGLGGGNGRYIVWLKELQCQNCNCNYFKIMILQYWKEIYLRVSSFSSYTAPVPFIFSSDISGVFLSALTLVKDIKIALFWHSQLHTWQQLY